MIQIIREPVEFVLHTYVGLYPAMCFTVTVLVLDPSAIQRSPQGNLPINLTDTDESNPARLDVGVSEW